MSNVLAVYVWASEGSRAPTIRVPRPATSSAQQKERSAVSLKHL